MHRMSGYDAAFIYDERPSEPQHTLKVASWGAEASARYAREGIDALRSEVAARLPDLPPLRWRAIRVPLDLHHPVWVEQARVDLDHHVRRLGVPGRGDRDAVCEVISEIAGQPLHPERPLWELWVLEGCEEDRITTVLKLSHALADGGESRALLEALFSDAPESTRSAQGEPLPTRWRLVRDALRDRLRDLCIEIPRLVWASLRATRRLRALRQKSDSNEALRPPLLDGPATPFAGPLGRRRVFHYAPVSLGDAKEIRRILDCSINDVVVATAAGAVRSYLRHHAALPGLPTLGHVPASTRTEAERGGWGNRLTTRPIALPTHVADPLERLRAAQAAARRMKADLAARAGANLEDWLRWLPPSAPKLLSLCLRTLIGLRPELPGGVIVSNVRGPERPLRVLGGEVEQIVSVGHMKYAAGLNITVWSYAGRLCFGLYADAEVVPDLRRIADAVSESFEDLVKAATREAARIA